MMPDSDETLLSVNYHQLYCPRSGLFEIGIKQFDGNKAIWGRRECAAVFLLDFPSQRRF
jgi:hypothetical protein